MSTLTLTSTPTLTRSRSARVTEQCCSSSHTQSLPLPLSLTCSIWVQLALGRLAGSSAASPRARSDASSRWISLTSGAGSEGGGKVGGSDSNVDGWRRRNVGGESEGNKPETSVETLAVGSKMTNLPVVQARAEPKWNR
ncbi:hypothetical protein B0H14DRAFT_3159748 [Mycena olivaceomarginata]|nr:hypothetical protein B0H14DRAFT_3159748 [Mycena olivaceomarginata]